MKFWTYLKKRFKIFLKSQIRHFKWWQWHLEINMLANTSTTHQVIDLVIQKRYHMIFKRHHQTANLFSTHIQLLWGTAHFITMWNCSFLFTNTNEVLVEIPILLKYVPQESMLLYSICTILIQIDTDTYLGNSNEYIQVHVQYPYTVMSSDSYVPLTKPQLITSMGVVYSCENAQLLIHSSEHICVSAIYYIGSVTKYIQCEVKHEISLKSDPTLLDVGDLIIPLNLLGPWTLVCAQEKRPFSRTLHMWSN